MSSQFVWTNRSKESLTLDLKSERDMEVFRRSSPRLMSSCRTWLLTQPSAWGSTPRRSSTSIRA